MSVNNFISFFFSLNACTGLKTVIFINFTVFLEFFVKSTIFVLVLASIAINGLWNRRSGPGGGTRRLHHFYGGDIGSTRVVKVGSSLGMVPSLSG